MSETSDFYVAVRRSEKDGFKFLVDNDGMPILMTKTAAEKHLRTAVATVGSVNAMLLRHVPVGIEIKVEIKE